MSAPQFDSDGRPFINLTDQLRAWERQLSPIQLQQAFDLVESWGWTRGSLPPPYVWAAAFAKVDT